MLKNGTPLRETGRFAFACLLTLLAYTSTNALESPRPSRVNSLSDAALQDVCFVDRLHGWAVGDRGVIWQTQDGGASWRLSDCPVTCQLNSVHFVDRTTGWIAGGWHHAGSTFTSGVVLKTTNGGITWQRVDDGTLPSLNQIRMMSFDQGWAIGHGSPLHASGVFRTRDGGKTWITVGGSTSTSWTAMGFSRSKVILGGVTGRLGSVETDLVKTNLLPPRPSSVNQIEMLSETEGWLVGDDGLLLQTRTAGAAWSQLASGVLPNVFESFHWNAIAQVGSTIWIAGNPGSVILKSSDAGASWQPMYTQSTIPIRAMTFVDEQLGFAVGDLGRILASSDGGRTWRTMRSGANRLALSILCENEKQVPFELLAEQAANRGYISGVTVLGMSEDISITQSSRTRSAVVHSGGASFNKLSQERIEAVDGLNPESRAKLIQRITQHIHTWRPEVLVLAGASASKEFLKLVEVAIERAALEQPTLQVAGLHSWRVNKVYHQKPKAGSISYRSEQVAPAISDTLQGYCCYSRWVNIPTGESSIPDKLYFELLSNESTAEPIQLVSRRGMMTGISYLKGDRLRRDADVQVVKISNSTLQSIRYRTTVDRIIDNAFAGNDLQKLIGELGHILKGLDALTAIDRLSHLVIRLERQHQYLHAMRVNHFILQEYAGHPFTERAYLSLMRMYTSSELMMQFARMATQNGTSDFKDSKQSNVARASATVETSPALGSNRNQRAIASTGSVNTYLEQFQLVERDFFKEAMDLLAHMKRNLPELSMDLRVRIPLLRVQHKVGASDNAAKYLRIWQSRQLFNPLDPESRHTTWSQAAIDEVGIKNSLKSNMGKLIPARFTSERPVLDGELSESIWEQSTFDSQSQRVQFYWDEEYLIIGVECAKKESEVYGPVTTERSYDQNLNNADRIVLELDSDRDYSTFQQLVIDHRGRCADSRIGDATWNPKWFISAGQTESTWTIECAIPWSQLAMRVPRRGDIWVVKVSRLLSSEDQTRRKPETALLHIH
ncbi:MAG: YCF48-related protein [Pirellulales bacterium]|nr:YCF48-related protein [Pirellulales bacterium]